MSPVAAAVLVYLLAISAVIVVYLSVGNFLQYLWERFRWGFAERRGATGRRVYRSARAALFRVWLGWDRLWSALCVHLLRSRWACESAAADLAGGLRRQRWVVREHLFGTRRKPQWGFASSFGARKAKLGFLAGVVLVGTGLTALLATHTFGSNGRNAAALGPSRLQAPPGPPRALLRPSRSNHPVAAHVRAHREVRVSRSIGRSHGQQQQQEQRAPAAQGTPISNVESISAPAAETTVAVRQSAAPSPLPAPEGPSAPKPLKAP
jgi:hypothetical protein